MPELCRHRGQYLYTCYSSTYLVLALLYASSSMLILGHFLLFFTFSKTGTRALRASSPSCSASPRWLPLSCELDRLLENLCLPGGRASIARTTTDPHAALGAARPVAESRSPSLRCIPFPEKVARRKETLAEGQITFYRELNCEIEGFN